MKQYKILFSFFFLIFQQLISQEDYEYFGAIKISQDQIISYKIYFNETNGVLSGYSITDLGGVHETKSYISGYFDDKANTLEFYENGILYTKSHINQNDFCFVNFSGTLKKLNEKQQIEGKFKGLYSDGKECISGEIILGNLGGILKRAKKIDKKIDRSVLIGKEKKEKVNFVKELDSINTNRLNKDETLSIFVKEDEISLTIYDAGQEDGDKISILLNGKEFYRNLEAFSKKKTIEIPLTTSKTELKITALNNGSIGGNTVMLQINYMDNTIETVTNLKKGQSAQFVFLKKK